MKLTNKVIGKCGISAKVICDSISENGKRITTFELEYPRWILSELNTHRMLSKNSASSRAVPVERMALNILENTATPVWWGQKQAGMSAKEEIPSGLIDQAKEIWNEARNCAIEYSKELLELGLHKQIANRVPEVFSMMKTVLTGTEFNNLFWLRLHEDAQPEFQELARVMKEAYDESVPTVLNVGEWHLPYIMFDNVNGDAIYMVGQEVVDLETAKQVSSSCCAQVSYRRLDESIQKAKDIFNSLISAARVHASPFEHQATPIPDGIDWIMIEGVTHIKKDRSLWSGNLGGWIQYRQLIPNNTKWGTVA